LEKNGLDGLDGVMERDYNELKRYFNFSKKE
jgi:hypothetical protein